MTANKVKVTSSLLSKYRQVQLRVYTPNGRFLQPMKNWYRIADEWGLKIKKGQYKMSYESTLIAGLNKTLDDFDKRKIPYELMFFDGSERYKDIHNINTFDGWDGNYAKIIPRKISSFID